MFLQRRDEERFLEEREEWAIVSSAPRSWSWPWIFWSETICAGDARDTEHLTQQPGLSHRREREDVATDRGLDDRVAYVRGPARRDRRGARPRPDRTRSETSSSAASTRPTPNTSASDDADQCVSVMRSKRPARLSRDPRRGGARTSPSRRRAPAVAAPPQAIPLALQSRRPVVEEMRLLSRRTTRAPSGGRHSLGAASRAAPRTRAPPPPVRHRRRRSRRFRGLREIEEQRRLSDLAGPGRSWMRPGGGSATRRRGGRDTADSSARNPATTWSNNYSSIPYRRRTPMGSFPIGHFGGRFRAPSPGRGCDHEPAEYRGAPGPGGDARGAWGAVRGPPCPENIGPGQGAGNGAREIGLTHFLN